MHVVVSIVRDGQFVWKYVFRPFKKTAEKSTANARIPQKCKNFCSVFFFFFFDRDRERERERQRWEAVGWLCT